MTNIEIIIILLIAGGFGYVITKLTKIQNIVSLLVSMQVGKMMVHQVDDETISFSITEEDEEDE